MEVLCSVMEQLKMACCKDEAMTLLKVKALLRAIDRKGSAFIDIEEVWKTLSAISDTEAGPSQAKENCLQRAWARHAVIVKSKHLQSVANTQVKMYRLVRQEF